MSSTSIEDAAEIIKLGQQLQFLTIARQYVTQALPYEHKPITDKINAKISKFQKQIKSLEKEN